MLEYFLKKEKKIQKNNKKERKKCSDYAKHGRTQGEGKGKGNI